jgi:hypothetical protein
MVRPEIEEQVIFFNHILLPEFQNLVTFIISFGAEFGIPEVRRARRTYKFESSVRAGVTSVDLLEPPVRCLRQFQWNKLMFQEFCLYRLDISVKCSSKRSNNYLLSGNYFLIPNLY